MRAHATPLVEHLFPNELPETRQEYINNLSGRGPPQKKHLGDEKLLAECLKQMDPDTHQRFLGVSEELQKRKARALLKVAQNDVAAQRAVPGHDDKRSQGSHQKSSVESVQNESPHATGPLRDSLAYSILSCIAGAVCAAGSVWGHITPVRP